MTKLLPCPFCGSELDSEDSDTLHQSGILWQDHPAGFRHYFSRNDGEFSWNHQGKCYVVNCCLHYGGCGANISGDSKEEAIVKWNTRKGAHNATNPD